MIDPDIDPNETPMVFPEPDMESEKVSVLIPFNVCGFQFECGETTFDKLTEAGITTNDDIDRFVSSGHLKIS
jgi:hypothetical protein